MRQASLMEALIDPRLGSNERLSKIDALIDWSPIEAIVRKLRSRSRRVSSAAMTSSPAIGRRSKGCSVR